ncbi:hypothetical protein VTN00DRAFT_10093 [Thermoascus crustaceus]|uniref:uncharacterized protein n=1 Tax=Thermoascus crustaceus TaxID=5088 RepID=UPI003742C3C4
MLNRASRRICAFNPPKKIPAHYYQTPTTRSFFTGAQPGIRTRYGRQQSSSPLKQKQYVQSQARHLSFLQRTRYRFREASRGIWRKNPILFPFALASAATAVAMFAYVIYIKVTRIDPQYTNFPPQVADALRGALYYTEIDLKPVKALEWYKEALRVAIEKGMHPYSDEVVGIKLQVALMLEKAGLVNPAVEVLERTKAECLDWVEKSRRRKMLKEKEELAGMNKNKKKEDPDKEIKIEDPDVLEAEQERKEQEEYEERQRDKTLKKVVGMNIKLAELYASDYIQDEKKAEAAQVAAVELCLKEMRRRQSLGLPVGVGSKSNPENNNNPDDNSWMNLTEIATAMEELASTYTNQEKHELAIPLYLQALSMIKEDEGDNTTCKQVVLLNNVASAMAGQAQKPPRPSKVNPSQTPLTQEQIIDAAKKWAQKALDVAAKIQPPVRDEDCDVSCVVATYNLGELAEMLNQRGEAEKRYREAKALAQGIGFEDGITMADGALKRLAKKK